MRELAGHAFSGFGSGAAGLDLFQGLAASGELGHDGVDGGGPDEGFGVLIPYGEKVLDGGHQMVDAEEGVAAEAFVGSIRLSQLQLVGTV